MAAMLRADETMTRLARLFHFCGGIEMKALVCTGVGRTSVQDWPEPSPNYGEVVIRVLAAGLCGTDRHITDGSYTASRPVVLGHEVVGVVEYVGQEAKMLKIGDRVSLDPNLSCGVCRQCHSGASHLCDALSSYGVTRDGGLASYMSVAESQCYLLPHGLSPATGILAEPLSCVIHALDRANVISGMSAAVWGLGTAGMLMIQYLRYLGITSITAVSHRAEHRERAMYHGATMAVAPDQALESPVDIAIDASGSISAFQSGLSSLRKGGKLLLYGVAHPSDQAVVHPERLFRDEITILGSFVGPKTMDRALNVLKAGIVQADSVLGDVLTLEEAAHWVSNRNSTKKTKVYTVF